MFHRQQLLVLTLVNVLGLGLLMCQSEPAWAQKPKDPQWSHAFDLPSRKFGEADFSDKTQRFGVEVFRDINNGLGLYLAQGGSLAVVAGLGEGKLPLADSKHARFVVGMDLHCRKAGVEDWKDAKPFSIEAFRDENNGTGIYITEKGLLTVLAGPKDAPLPTALKGHKLSHSVDLRCRKGGVRDFKDAAKFGIEVYRDNTLNNLVYICETGSIAVIADSGKGGDGKAPEWLHGLDLKCRKSGEDSFTKETRKFGVEVYRDVNNGNLIFISEEGTIAVTAPNKDLKAPTPDVKDPIWTHGLNLKCRNHGEKDFSDKTRVFGIEVFRDDNTGTYIYISENGTIAAAVSK